MLWLCGGSTDFSKTPDEQAAQFFHFDMDRPRWLKFFSVRQMSLWKVVHTCLLKFAQNKGNPKSILKKGYVRLSEASN